AEMGAGVANWCIVLSFVSRGALFPTLEKLRCIHGISNKLVAQNGDTHSSRPTNHCNGPANERNTTSHFIAMRCR
ncbi:hypothetical protein, partial [Streptomyces indiaensis]|uniref:hypothetical protein n=1 Tax=Streptomyces indiaensis TaxID=284033 RepID=UPI001F1CEF06